MRTIFVIVRRSDIEDESVDALTNFETPLAEIVFERIEQDGGIHSAFDVAVTLRQLDMFLDQLIEELIERLAIVLEAAESVVRFAPDRR